MNTNFPSTKKTLTESITLILTLLLIIPSVFGFLSIQKGKDINWDLRNYHFYNGYAFLENRLGYDIAPAQQQTYLNPILDIPLYIVYTRVPAKTVGFIYGFLHGLNISLLLIIFLQLSLIKFRYLNYLIGLCIVGLSSLAPGFLSELGGSMNDNIISLLTLLGISIAISAIKDPSNNSNFQKRIGIFISGIVMGLTVGVKLTGALFAVSLGIMLLFFYKTTWNKLAAFGLYIAGGLIGFLTCDGAWMLMLWQEYLNPLFPQFNNLFHSPLVENYPYLDQRFLPRTWQEYLTWPLVISQDSLRVSELYFSDIRFSVLYSLAVTWIGVNILGKLTNRPFHIFKKTNTLLFNRNAGTLLLGFLALSFIFWMCIFSIYRYIVVLELLAPLCVLLILDRLFSTKQFIIVVSIFVILVASMNFQPYDWGRDTWESPYIQVEVPSLDNTNIAEVVMLGYSPMSYVIPFFPQEFRFLRPESNFLRDYKSGLNKKIKMILQETDNTIFIIFNKNDNSVDLEYSAAQLDLQLNSLLCTEIKDNMPEELIICEILQ